jgi:dihydrodipicolinate synthase/N-acetylneuraminate lyase
MHEKRHEFKGVVPAIITPYDSDGNLNEEAYRSVMEFNIREGAHGFWVAGGSGEGVLLEDDERIRLAHISAEQARGRAKVIVHVGALTTRSSIRIAEEAAKADIDAIASVPPFFYPPDDDTIVKHYKALGAATGLPLFLYNWPRTTGVEITPPLMERLVDEVPQLAGLKHSVPNLYNLRTFVGMGNAHEAGDLKRAEEAQEKGNKLRDLIGTGAYHAAFKVILGARLGIDCGTPRPPLPQLSKEDAESLLKRMREAGAI